MAKQPPVRFQPFAAVEDAVEEMIWMRSASRFVAMSRLPAMVLVPEPTVRVLDADRGPETVSWAPMEEEAWEMNPPVRVARLVTPRVEERVEAPATMREEEALKGPDTFRFDAMEEEAREIIPPPIVKR